MMIDECVGVMTSDTYIQLCKASCPITILHKILQLFIMYEAGCHDMRPHYSTVTFLQNTCHKHSMAKTGEMVWLCECKAWSGFNIVHVVSWLTKLWQNLDHNSIKRPSFHVYRIPIVKLRELWDCRTFTDQKSFLHNLPLQMSINMRLLNNFWA